MDSSSAEISDVAAPVDARLLPVALGLGFLVAAFVIAFFPSIKWMAGEWSDGGDLLSHGYLIVVISTVLFIRAVPQVAALGWQPAWWLLPIIFGVSVTWLLGYVATVVVVQTIVLPALLMMAIAAAFGFKASRPLAFAVLFLYFAVPAWTYVQPVFQGITVFVVGLMIRASDIPALLQSNFVHLSSGSFEIADACSGVSFVVAGLSLAVLYGHLYYTKIWQKVSLILITLLVAMIGNWIRVFGVIVMGYRTDMQTSLVDDHSTVGWILFGLLLVPVFFIARRMEEDELPGGSTGSQVDEVALPVQEKHRVAIIVVVVTMIAGPFWAFTIAKPDAVEDTLQLKVPVAVQPWQGPMMSKLDWSPQFAGPTVERLVEYRKGEDSVFAYLNLYLSQKQDQELIYFSNSVSGSWRDIQLKDGLAPTIETVSGLNFRQLAAHNYTGNWLIWYRYQVGDRFETSDTRTKVVQALQSLRGQPEAGIIAFASPCSKTCDQAASTLADFVDQVGHLVRLDFTRDEK